MCRSMEVHLRHAILEFSSFSFLSFPPSLPPSFFLLPFHLPFFLIFTAFYFLKNLFLAVLRLCCHAWAFSSFTTGLIAVASLVAHSCGSWA